MLGTSPALSHKDRGPFVGAVGHPEKHPDTRCCYTPGYLGNMLAVVVGCGPEGVLLDMRFRASRFARSLQAVIFVLMMVH